jgi:hypothetical protein
MWWGALRRIRRVVRRTFRRALGTKFMRAELFLAGYETRPRAPIDLRGLETVGPLEAWTRCRGQRVLIDLDLARCRSLDLVGFSCAPSDPNPFVETARAILDGSVHCYDGSPLQRYYESFTPARILDIYGWAARGCSATLRQKAVHAVAPWQGTPGEHMADIRRRVSARDHAQLGEPPTGDDSWIDWGPVSPAKGQIEFRRIAEVTASISAKGYLFEPEEDDHILAHLMVDGNDVVAWIMSGHHRVAALGALGYRSAPIVILRDLYRREEVDTWPGVVSGAFTPAQALAAFDMVFRGRRPPAPGCDWMRPTWAARRPARAAAG